MNLNVNLLSLIFSMNQYGFTLGLNDSFTNWFLVQCIVNPTHYESDMYKSVQKFDSLTNCSVDSRTALTNSV